MQPLNRTKKNKNKMKNNIITQQPNAKIPEETSNLHPVKLDTKPYTKKIIMQQKRHMEVI